MSSSDVELRQFLRRVTLFTHLTNSRLRKVQGLLKTKKYLRGEIVIKEGQLLEEIVIIKTGECIICKTISLGEGKGHKRVQLAQVGSTQFFGCREALSEIDPNRQQESAVITSYYELQASSESIELLVLTRSEFLKYVVGEEEATKKEVFNISEAFSSCLETLLENARRQTILAKDIITGSITKPTAGEQSISNNVNNTNKHSLSPTKLRGNISIACDPISPTSNNSMITNTQRLSVLSRFLDKKASLPSGTTLTNRLNKIAKLPEGDTAITAAARDLLPQRIQQVQQMVSMSQKSEEFSQRFYENTNQATKDILDQVKYDVSAFSLQKDFNLVYNKVNLFNYSHEDEAYMNSPKAYKKDLLEKMANRQANGGESSQAESIKKSQNSQSEEVINAKGSQSQQQQSSQHLKSQSSSLQQQQQLWTSTSPRSVLPSPRVFTTKLEELQLLPKTTTTLNNNISPTHQIHISLPSINSSSSPSSLRSPSQVLASFVSKPLPSIFSTFNSNQLANQSNFEESSNSKLKNMLDSQIHQPLNRSPSIKKSLGVQISRNNTNPNPNDAKLPSQSQASLAGQRSSSHVILRDPSQQDIDFIARLKRNSLPRKIAPSSHVGPLCKQMTLQNNIMSSSLIRASPRVLLSPLFSTPQNNNRKNQQQQFASFNSAFAARVW